MLARRWEARADWEPGGVAGVMAAKRFVDGRGGGFGRQDQGRT